MDMASLAQKLVELVPRLADAPFWLVTLLVIAAVGVVVLVYSLLYEGLATLAERKVAGDIQVRVGPNRVGPWGLLQWLADGIKLMAKEDLVPAAADRPLFVLAPYLVFAGSFAAFVVLPFGWGLSPADLDIGAYYVLAVSSLVTIGIVLGAWASSNKWALLGGMRAAAQMISFEIPAGLSLLAPVLIAGSLSLQTIVRSQDGLGGLLGWNLFHDPFLFVAFFVYFTAGMAECNRTPFDIPEAESELVSGYHVEYSAIRFSFFFMAEYGDMFVVSALATACFLGGWQIPFVRPEDLTPWVAYLLSMAVFQAKTLFLVFVMMWLRWTLPRLRVDRLMVMCWKYLLPLAIVNLLGAAAWHLVVGRGLPALVAGWL